MICPYCVEDVPDGSQQHNGCAILNNKKFPAYYVDSHGHEGDSEPVILSVVGFRQHGKTVYLCALFDFLDNHLWENWPGFYNQVLDQASLSRLNESREKLRKGILPEATGPSFPRPGIFRLTNMPEVGAGNGMPPLEDTTVLIYDPPGEAFDTEDSIVESARFVKSSSCVLFLIDIPTLAKNDAVADEMAKLLDTYILGMRRMEIQKRSQHMIVVYTKSDKMKSAVPEFRGYLEKEPVLEEYLNDQRPKTLSDPSEHRRYLETISQLLYDFTKNELRAGKFINEANDWFASVSYTAVSSLGSPPEESESGTKLTVRMSPRCVADPLLYVLAKSIKVKEPEPPPQGQTWPPPPSWDYPQQTGWQPWMVIAAIVGVITFIIVLVFLLFSGSGDKTQSNLNRPPSTSPSPPATPSPSKSPTSPPGMAYVPGGEFTMGSTGRDIYEQPPHKVTVKPFYMDSYEVTCEEYARFAKETGRAPPPGWQGGQYPRGAARLPVTGVTWDDAVAYASWIGKRLPTEEEWEFAARGSDARLYPWGAEWKEGMSNAGGASVGGPVDVGSFKGVSPFGVYDMVGNVWEWTASDLKAYPGGRLPVAPQGTLKVIRGGSWKEDRQQATATYRGYLLARGSKDYSATGFRCVRDVTALTPPTSSK